MRRSSGIGANKSNREGPGHITAPRSRSTPASLERTLRTFAEQEPHASIQTRGSLMQRTALVVTAAARRRRWLVTRAPVVAAGASSGVRSGERHPDTKNDAGKHTCKELPLAQFEHAAHLPSAVRAP